MKPEKPFSAVNEALGRETNSILVRYALICVSSFLLGGLGAHYLLQYLGPSLPSWLDVGLHPELRPEGHGGGFVEPVFWLVGSVLVFALLGGYRLFPALRQISNQKQQLNQQTSSPLAWLAVLALGGSSAWLFNSPIPAVGRFVVMSSLSTVFVIISVFVMPDRSAKSGQQDELRSDTAPSLD